MVSIILPTYNEAGNISKLIAEIKKVLINNFEIIVVDDNSPDKTGEILKRNFRGDPRIKIFIRKKDKGLASAILYGILHSQGNYIIVMDTDFNHDPSAIPLFLRLKKNYDFIIGSRYIKGGGMENKLRYILSQLYNLSVRGLLNLPVHDCLSGYFLIRRDKLFEFELEKIFQGYGDYFIRLIEAGSRSNLAIGEIPVYYKNRIWGVSKSRLISMLINYSKTVIELYKARQ